MFYHDCHDQSYGLWSNKKDPNSKLKMQLIDFDTNSVSHYSSLKSLHRSFFFFDFCFGSSGGGPSRLYKNACARFCYYKMHLGGLL